MGEINSKKSSFLKSSLEYSANTPLWQRVPTRDENGKYLGDFMMVITGLKKASTEHRKNTLNAITQVLTQYSDIVVFADLNMKMSLLWVSIKPVKGMMIEIPAAIIESVPEAKLISDRAPSV
jgi:hypothetical protein